LSLVGQVNCRLIDVRKSDVQIIKSIDDRPDQGKKFVILSNLALLQDKEILNGLLRLDIDSLIVNEVVEVFKFDGECREYLQILANEIPYLFVIVSGFDKNDFDSVYLLITLLNSESDFQLMSFAQNCFNQPSEVPILDAFLKRYECSWDNMD